MRPAASLLLAALTLAAAGLAVERVGLAADPPKTKQQINKEKLRKKLAEANRRKAAEAKPAEPTPTP